MPAIRGSIIAAALCCAVAGPASADTVVYYRAGGWDAFSGTDADGRQICGIGSTNPTDGRGFSVRFVIGGADVVFEAKKPAWVIPDGTQLPVVIQIGLDTPWNLQGAGNGQVVSWALDRNAIQAFDAQFRRASSMTVTFPGGNEPPWTVGLNGSTAISNAFGRCITDLSNRAQAQAQSAAPAVAPTQPYAPGAAAPPPVAPAPTQPTAPAPTQPNAAPPPR